MTKWLNEWLSDWVTEWLNDWVTEWLSDWVTEWLSDWVTKWQFWVSDLAWIGELHGSNDWLLIQTSNFLSIYLSIFLYNYLYNYLSINLDTYIKVLIFTQFDDNGSFFYTYFTLIDHRLTIHLNRYLSIYLSIYLLYIYLSHLVCLHIWYVQVTCLIIYDCLSSFNNLSI